MAAQHSRVRGGQYQCISFRRDVGCALSLHTVSLIVWKFSEPWVYSVWLETLWEEAFLVSHWAAFPSPAAQCPFKHNILRCQDKIWRLCFQMALQLGDVRVAGVCYKPVLLFQKEFSTWNKPPLAMYLSCLLRDNVMQWSSLLLIILNALCVAGLKFGVLLTLRNHDALF